MAGYISSLHSPLLLMLTTTEVAPLRVGLPLVTHSDVMKRAGSECKCVHATTSTTKGKRGRRGGGGGGIRMSIIRKCLKKGTTNSTVSLMEGQTESAAAATPTANSYNNSKQLQQQQLPSDCVFLSTRSWGSSRYSWKSRLLQWYQHTGHGTNPRIGHIESSSLHL